MLRYGREEALLGRMAGDPFTGLVFREGRQPLAATELKARMDRFWSRHPEVAAPRTLNSSYSSARTEPPAKVARREEEQRPSFPPSFL